MFLGQLCTFIYTFWKNKKLKKEIQCGKEIYFGDHKGGKYCFNLKDIYITLLILLLMYYFFIMDRFEMIVINIIIIGISLVFSLVINKVRPERDTNVMMQAGYSIVLVVMLIMFGVVIIADEGENVALKQEKLPLLITDYRECTEEIDDIDYYHERNFLGSMDVYYIFGEDNSIYYLIYKSEYAKILDKIWEKEFAGKTFNEGAVECTADWNAEKAMRNGIGTYYVRYEDVILVFSDDEDVYLTTEQIDIIRDKLDLR